MRKLRKAAMQSLILGAALFEATGASAMSLVQAYEAALKNDPAYRSAFFANESGKENRILGRSNLLPNVAASYSASKNNSTIEQFGKEFPQRYISRSATVQVRQSVFNLDAIARYKQGVAQSEYAEAQFDTQSQDVVIRVVSAYLEVLFKEDQVRLAQAERDMYAEQKNANELLFRKGEGTRTDMIETQSRLDLAEAQLLESQDALANAKDTLAGIVGGQVDTLDHLRGGFRVAPAESKTYDDWKRLALENNPEIRTLEKGVEIAKQEINKQRAGHVPRMDVIGTYGKQESDSITTVNQSTTVRSIGFQISVPIYSGGQVSAATRQAVAGREKANADLETQIDKVLVELRRNYNLMASSAARIDALVKAADSAQLLVTATEQSIKGGVRINLDLLTAQRQLYTVRRDLAQARYGYMIGLLRLKAGAGALGADDVRMLAAYFE